MKHFVEERIAMAPHQRALGSFVAGEAKRLGVPRHLVALAPWWLPDANPFPRFRFLTLRRKGA